MGRIRRSAVRAVVALLLVSLTIPGEVLRPDPAAVAAAALRRPDRAAPAPAAPGTFRSSSSAGFESFTFMNQAEPSASRLTSAGSPSSSLFTSTTSPETGT